MDGYDGHTRFCVMNLSLAFDGKELKTSVLTYIRTALSEGSAAQFRHTLKG